MGSSPQDYWGLMIDPERMCPSPRLEALLSGIAHYIIKNLEPREHHVLTPDKLANFYQSVGGNYDKLFLEASPASLSFVFQALGCYHSLQPAADPFKPPAIPALTASGFKRWQTIQILLEPASQVALLQETLRKYDIVNKADGHLFPKVLPVECFPREPDSNMIKWHDESLKRLKREAEEEAAAKTAPAPRPAIARMYSGTPQDDESSSDGDERNSGYFSMSRLKKGVSSRWDAFRGEGPPSSREDRDRDRRRRVQDAVANGTYRYHNRPSLDDNGRRRSHPGHRPTGSGESGRGGRSRIYTATDYESPPSPGDTGYEPRSRVRKQYAPRGSPLSPGIADRDRDRDWDRNRDRGRGHAPSVSPRSPTPPDQPPRPNQSSRMPRPVIDQYGRRHSSHEPLSPRDDNEASDYVRARSRSHNGRSPNERLSPSEAYGAKSSRPMSTYIPSATTATSSIPATAPPPFARGNLRHTVHSPQGNQFRGRDRSNEDDSRTSAGIRFIPADRSRRMDRA